MTNSNHPNYPNPIILEAICEIAFELPTNSVWNIEWFGEFYKHLQSDFPIFYPTNLQSICYKSNSHPIILQLFQD